MALSRTEVTTGLLEELARFKALVGHRRQRSGLGDGLGRSSSGTAAFRARS